MTARDVFLIAKDCCPDCGYPQQTHRGACRRVEVIPIRLADVETLRAVGNSRLKPSLKN